MNVPAARRRGILAARLACAGLSLSLALLPAVRAQPVGIPSMGAAGSDQLSPMLERTLGDAIMERGRHDPTYISDPDVDQYLTSVGRKLVSHSPYGAQHIQVFAVRDPDINAFTLPGGYIGVNSGLVVATDDESELASVIAHEVGHVVQRHVARGMAERSQGRGVMLATLAAALLAALSGSGDLAMGVASFGQAAAVNRQLSFSRSAEQEADREGFNMMTKAGYDPRGMAQMFRRLMKASNLNEGTGGNAFARTHPLSIQRLSDIENRISELPPHVHHDTSTYWYVRAQLLALQARDSRAQDQALQQFQADARAYTGVRRSAAWYGVAYVARLNQNTAKAEKALEQARRGNIDSAEIEHLAIQLANDQGKTAQALKLARSAWARWPDSRSIALALARTMQANGKSDDAVAFLDARIKQWPHFSGLYKLKAQNEDKLGKKVAARRAMAGYYEQTGALLSAVEQLRQARELSNDFYEKSELDARIRQVKQRLQTERSLLEQFKMKPQ
jgi:predicted Zn-dependent protease